MNGMQRRYKILVMGFLVIALIAAQPTQVSADRDDDYDDESLSIEVVRAEYLDYDKDGKEDDIITVFRVITPDDEWEKGEIYISCAVQKPSGDTIGTTFEVYTRDGVEITIVWFNWADEKGDYTLYIKAAADDDDVGPAYMKHVFDPPGGKDVGEPEIAIMNIDEL